jgi:hypothetical protein
MTYSESEVNPPTGAGLAGVQMYDLSILVEPAFDVHLHLETILAQLDIGAGSVTHSAAMVLMTNGVDRKMTPIMTPATRVSPKIPPPMSPHHSCTTKRRRQELVWIIHQVL